MALYGRLLISQIEIELVSKRLIVHSQIRQMPRDL
jgi:hypothetical protein